MNEEKDFFKKCFNIVAGMEAKNVNETIAKEVVLDEVENLQSQLKQKEKQLNDIKEEIINHLTFCKNDSGGAYDKCNMVIKHYEKLLSIIERNNSDE